MFGEKLKIPFTKVSDEETSNKQNQICQRRLLLIPEESKGAWCDYVKVTAPMVVHLDKCNSEEKAYMGCLLPQFRLPKSSVQI